MLVEIGSQKLMLNPNQMKCSVCGEEINLTFYGTPEDICWGCLFPNEKDVVVKKNIDKTHGHDDHAFVHAKK